MKKAYYNTKLGTVEMKYEDDILYSLKINAIENDENQKSDFTDKVYNQINEYLNGRRKSFNIKYLFVGTEFQKSVWREIEKIPYSKTITYLEIAQNINNPKAVRAVGNACNKNPIWLIVPCHRVIGKNGNLTGYAGGLEMKMELLEIENKN